MKNGKESTALVKIDAGVLENIDKVVSACNITALGSTPNVFKRSMDLAQGIQQLRGLISGEVLNQFLALQGSPLGFRTDKDHEGGYDPVTVRECLIEAALNGAYPVNNEFNIIGRRCYFTKEFFTRKNRELEGLTDLDLNFELIEIKEQGAKVQGYAKWRVNGQEMDIGYSRSCIIPVRVNKGQGADAILGKAERKLRAMIHRKVTGSEHTLLDGDATDAATLEAEVVKKEDLPDEEPKSKTAKLKEQVQARLNGGNGKTKTAQRAYRIVVKIKSNPDAYIGTMIERDFQEPVEAGTWERGGLTMLEARNWVESLKEIPDAKDPSKTVGETGVFEIQTIHDSVGNGGVS